VADDAEINTHNGMERLTRWKRRPGVPFDIKRRIEVMGELYGRPPTDHVSGIAQYMATRPCYHKAATTRKVVRSLTGE